LVSIFAHGLTLAPLITLVGTKVGTSDVGGAERLEILDFDDCCCLFFFSFFYQRLNAFVLLDVVYMVKRQFLQGP